jgi:hypothetical protein
MPPPPPPPAAAGVTTDGPTGVPAASPGCAARPAPTAVGAHGEAGLGAAATAATARDHSPVGRARAAPTDVRGATTTAAAGPVLARVAAVPTTAVVDDRAAGTTGHGRSRGRVPSISTRAPHRDAQRLARGDREIALDAGALAARAAEGDSLRRDLGRRHCLAVPADAALRAAQEHTDLGDTLRDPRRSPYRAR